MGVLDQLRYAGLLEVCRIRQVGYPVRKEFKEFYRRYRVLTPGANDAKKVAKALEAKELLPAGEYQLGKNKVFLRNGPFNDLEAERDIAVRGQTILLQRIARGYLARVQLKKYKQTLENLKKAIEKRDMATLKSAISDSGDLPYQGKHIALVKEAGKVLERLEEEARVTKLIEAAIEKRELNALKSAVGAADEMIFTSSVVDKAKKL